jgi:hypothetical protein
MWIFGSDHGVNEVVGWIENTICMPSRGNEPIRLNGIQKAIISRTHKDKKARAVDYRLPRQCGATTAIMCEMIYVGFPRIAVDSIYRDTYNILHNLDILEKSTSWNMTDGTMYFKNGSTIKYYTQDPNRMRGRGETLHGVTITHLYIDCYKITDTLKEALLPSVIATSGKALLCSTR